MLLKDKKISDKEKAQVKEAAKELLKRLKKKEFKVQYWTEKIQTASAVKKVIENYLFEKITFSHLMMRIFKLSQKYYLMISKSVMQIINHLRHRYETKKVLILLKIL